jgi:hypothetical protein
MTSAGGTRVVRGEGLLHAHKVQYSKDTHELLKGNNWIIIIMKCWDLSLYNVDVYSELLKHHALIILFNSSTAGKQTVNSSTEEDPKFCP